jgi:hypothetical protein
MLNYGGKDCLGKGSSIYEIFVSDNEQKLMTGVNIKRLFLFINDGEAQ